MHVHIYIFSVICASVVSAEENTTLSIDFEKLLRDCHIHDRMTLDSCLFEIAEQLRPLLPTGVPELNIPPLEPLSITNFTFNVATLRIDFTNLQVQGLSKYDTEYSRSNPQNFSYKLGLEFPHLEITGHYNINGYILLLPIIGDGPFWAELYNVKTDVENWLEVTEVRNQEQSYYEEDIFNGPEKDSKLCIAISATELPEEKQLRLKMTNTHLHFDHSKIYLDNLFNGDKFLGASINKFLNDKVNEVIQEFQPQMTKKLDLLIRMVFGDAVAKLPYDEWISAINT